MLDAARHAFVDGLGLAAWTGAGVLVVSAALAVWMLRGEEHAEALTDDERPVRENADGAS